MKKVLFSLAFAASALVASAQDSPVSKGKIGLGVNLGANLGSGKSENKPTVGNAVPTRESSEFGFNIGLLGQYFIMDKLSLGLGIGYSSSSSSSKNPSLPSPIEFTNSSSTFYVSPLTRYYIMLDDKFGFFGEFMVPISMGTRVSDQNPSTATSKSESSTLGLGFQVAPGVVFFPTPKVGIEARIGNLLGYSLNTSTQKVTGGEIVSTSSNVSILNVNSFNMSLGFNYYF